MLPLTVNPPVQQCSISLDVQPPEWYGCLNQDFWRQRPNSISLYVLASIRQEMVLTLDRFRNLGDGWLGPGTKQIPNETVDRVISIANALGGVDGLPNPEVTPNGNGTISLEWEVPSGEVYVEFGRTRVSGFARVGDHPTGYFNDLSNLPDSFLREVRAQLYPPLQTTSVTFQGAEMNGYTVA